MGSSNKNTTHKCCYYQVTQMIFKYRKRQSNQYGQLYNHWNVLATQDMRNYGELMGLLCTCGQEGHFHTTSPTSCASACIVFTLVLLNTTPVINCFVNTTTHIFTSDARKTAFVCSQMEELTVTNETNHLNVYKDKQNCKK